MSARFFFITVILFSGLTIFAQQNIFITKSINYLPENKSYTKGKALFDNAAITSQSDDIPYFMIQRKIGNSVDSVDLFLMNTLFETKNNLPSSEEIRDLKPIFYKISAARGQKILTVFILPFSEENNKVKALKKFDLLVTVYSSKKTNLHLKGNTKWADNSVLATGDWYKVKIDKSGIYKVTGADLAAMGISLGNIAVNEVRLYGNGGGMMPESNAAFFYDDLKEDAIEVVDKNGNGKFDSDDYFLFYGQGPNIWKYDENLNRFGHSQNLYDDFAYYFITVKSGNALRVNTLQQNNGSPTITVNDFLDFEYHDKDSLNIIKSGKKWFGEEFNIINSYNFSFTFPNLNTSKAVKIKIAAAAHSTSPSTLNFVTNGLSTSLLLPAISGNYSAAYASYAKTEFLLNSTSNTVSITASYTKSTSSSVAWLDYIEVQAYRHLTMTGSQMPFTNPDATAAGQIAKFQLENASPDLKIWDITNPTEPKNLAYTLNNNTLTFKQATDSLREFIAFKGGYYQVDFVEKIANQNLHNTKTPDYVICYYKAFEKQAQQLADFHRQRDGMDVFIVEQSKLFNEFSGGAVDIAALRNFMKMLYDKALANGNEPPKYLLLFGDASYDYKDRIANNTNKVLTFESSASLNPSSSYSSDDFFGLLDDNEGANCYGSLDIGIGRFPVNTLAQADLMIDKIKRYTATHTSASNSACNSGQSNISNLADWRNIVCFIGDDQDNNIHVSQADYLAEYVGKNYPVYNIDKIFLDAYVQQTTPGGQRYPEAKRDLNSRINNGALVLNYTGHGGEIGLAHESLLDLNDIQSWTNHDNLPLFVTATCEFSRYDDPQRTSAGEYTLLHENGGMIALLTTSRLTYSSYNFTINKIIYENIFKKNGGSYPALGDVIRKSKVGAGSRPNNRNIVLLSDPALKLSYPEYQVVTDSINGTAIDQYTDTLGALSKVTISGRIENQGQVMTNFNGFLYPKVFDKKQTYTTLGNDPDSQPMEFKMQKNILYKGKVSVKNGIFKFSFIIPKDINYSIGKGKISYYAENGIRDANGYHDSLLIGGNSKNIINDSQGPDIALYMNDTNFVSGGITDENPVLLAFISDENGINTTGNGIGHDITLTLDDNSSEAVELNSFYSANIDTYQSGVVKYALSNLSEGPHTITLKVWDILNNSNSASIDFVVASSDKVLISNVLNYPNPFSDYTNFVFEHNMECTEMSLEIQIFDNMGRLVRMLSTKVEDPGFRIADNELKWNGRSQNGGSLQSGIYTYKLVVKTDTKQSAVKTGKLVFLKKD